MLDKISQKIKESNTALQELKPQMDNLSQIKIPLDVDPLSKGLVSFNEKLAMIQESKDVICGLLNSIISIKSSIESTKAQLSKHISENRAKILESNQEYYLKTLKSQELRDDAFDKCLADESKLLSMLERLLIIVKGYQDSAKNQLSNLESTNNNLKKQLDVIDDMIAIGEIHK